MTTLTASAIATPPAAASAAAPSAPTVTSHHAEGQSLSISTTTFRRGERTAEAAAALGEEVATVLSGAFLVEAEDERYELSPGEGIVIPPRMARVWTCQSDEGALYRVITKLDAAA